MDKYTKVIEVKPKLEKLSTENSLASIVDGFFTNFQKQTNSNIESVKQKLASLKTGFEETGENKDKKSIVKIISNKADEVANKLEGMAKKSVEFMDDIKTSAISYITGLIENAIGEIQNMASYSLSTTLKINQDARDLALQYGLTDAQVYAYSKVKDEMGITSEEDVWLMTPAQRERFAQRIGYYSGEYDKLANEGFFQSYEKFQAAFNDFKQDIQMKVVEFFMNNEDTIMECLETGVDLLGKLLQAVEFISKLSGGNSQQQSLSDIINNYSSGNKNTNIKVDTTFNGVSLTDQAKLRDIGNELNRTLLSQIENS